MSEDRLKGCRDEAESQLRWSKATKTATMNALPSTELVALLDALEAAEGALERFKRDAYSGGDSAQSRFRRADTALAKIRALRGVPEGVAPPSEPRCPRCGYTALDAQIHLDHHLCDGEIPKSGGPDGSKEDG